MSILSNFFSTNERFYYFSRTKPKRDKLQKMKKHLIFYLLTLLSFQAIAQSADQNFDQLRANYKAANYKKGLQDALQLESSTYSKKGLADLNFWIIKFKVMLNQADVVAYFSKTEKQFSEFDDEKSNLNLAQLNYWQGLYNYNIEKDSAAGKYFLASKSIYDQLSDDEKGSTYIALLTGIGNHYYNAGKQKKALDFYTHSLDRIEKTNAPKDHNYLTALKNSTLVYKNLGEFETAIKTIEKATKAAKETLPEGDVSIALIINYAGKIYWHAGRDDLAEQRYLEGMKYMETYNHTDHEQYATYHNNLGVQYLTIGKFKKAEKLLKKTLELREKLYGRRHRRVSDILDNLGHCSIALGQYENAGKYFEEAYDIYVEVKGKDHPWTAWTGFDWSKYFIVTENFERAEELQLEGLKVYEDYYGKDHLSYANRQVTYGDLLYRKGDYEQAKEWVEAGLKVRLEKYGREHSRSASAILLLGYIYDKLGNIAKADEYINEGTQLFKGVYNEHHPTFVSGLEMVCELDYRTNDFEGLSQNIRTLNNSSKYLINKGTDHLSMTELYNYINLFESRFDIIASYVISQPEKLSEHFETVANNSITFKGFLLDKSMALEKFSQNDNPQIQQKYEEWKDSKSYLSRYYTDTDASKEVIEKFENKIELLEKDLVDNLSQIKEIEKNKTGFQSIRKNLKTDEVVLDFIHYQNHKAPEQTQYAAIITNADIPKPIIIPLFEEKELLKLFKEEQRTADYASYLYAVVDRGLKKKGEDVSTLFELIWKPILPNILNAKTVYFSPSGLLHKINLGAVITDQEDEIILDKFEMIQLNDFRNLKNINKPQPAPQSGDLALLFGGLVYGTMAEGEIVIAARNQSRTRGSLVLSDDNKDFRGDSWKPLHHTQKEIDNIHQLLKSKNFASKKLEGENGTEEYFKSINNQKSPKILHLATHGFFFPDPKQTKAKDAFDHSAKPFETSDHPMIRSGLIMSNANRAWKSGQLDAGQKEDGILTAYEISQMNLSNTELVVLSACETGLGDIRGNEGVYGLQRAFKMAGAKYLIMSLWQVPDKQTSILMTKFYEKWTEDNMPIPEAFRAAQKEMFEMGFDHYQWAGFVLVE